MYQSFLKYADGNRSRNIEKPWPLTSNGNGFKLMCFSLPMVYLDAIWVSYKELNKKIDNRIIDSILNGDVSDLQIDFSIFIDIVKLCCKYSSHKYMRRGWSVLWQSHFPEGAQGCVSPVITEGKKNWLKGFNMIRKFAPEIVRLLYFLCISLFC